MRLLFAVTCLGCVVASWSCGGKVSTGREYESSHLGHGGSAGSSSTGGSAGSAPSGGSAGYPAGGSGGVAGSAGYAGADPCLSPVLDGGPTNIESYIDTARESNPVLLAVDNDSSKAVLAYHWRSMPGGTITGVRFVPFSPWGVWPSDMIGPNVGIEPANNASEPIAAAAASGGAVRILSTVMDYADASWKVLLGETASPYTSWSWETAINEPGKEWTYAPLFVARGSEGSLLGYSATTSTPPHLVQLHGGSFADGVGYLPKLQYAACATEPIVADAIGVSADYLIGYTTSRECCLCDDGVDGPPMMAVLMPPSISSFGPFVLKGDMPLRFLRLVPREDGAWWVMGRETSTGTIRVEVAMVASLGYLVVSPQVWPHEFPSAAIAAAPLGNSLALGWMEPGEVHVATLSPQWNQSEAKVVDTSITTSDARQISVLSGPTGLQILLAWAGPDSEYGGRIKVARFSMECEK